VVGQHLPDRIVEREDTALDQPQRRDRRDRLGDARDPVAIGGSTASPEPATRSPNADRWTMSPSIITATDALQLLASRLRSRSSNTAQPALLAIALPASSTMIIWATSITGESAATGSTDAASGPSAVGGSVTGAGTVVTGGTPRVNSGCGAATNCA
jgi:hypothetical protein